MYTQQPKKVLIINILEILRKYTDENHRLSQKDIMKILEKEYMMQVDRKAVKRNLINLIDFGYDIEYTEVVRKNKKGETETMYTNWYINREFADSELRLLIDSLLFSKHIPYSQCKELIEKLKNLSSTYFDARVKYIRTLPDTAPNNKQLFYTIDVLDEAISCGKQVAFSYSTYDVDKKLHPKIDENGNARESVVNPYQIAATNGRYYLICNYDKYDNVAHARLDRITNIRMLDTSIKNKKNVTGLKNGFDLPKHMAEHIYMFSGPSELVSFRAKRNLAGDVIDWFGAGVCFKNITPQEFTAEVKVNLDAMFYWALQYGIGVTVLRPASLVDRLRTATAEMAQKYSVKKDETMD